MNTPEIAILTDASFGFYLARNYLTTSNKYACFITCSPLLFEKSKQEPRICSRQLFTKKRGLARYKADACANMLAAIETVIHQDSIKEVWCHEFYSLHWNVAINYLREKRPDISVFLLSDGSFNMFKKPMRIKHHCTQKILSQIHHYYKPYKGDWYGIDAEDSGGFWAEKIIMPKGMPHQYDPQRVQFFTFTASKQQQKYNKKTALIVEQSLADRGYINKETQQKIIAQIRQNLAERGIEQAFIIAHPKAKQRDFYHPDFIDLTYDEISLEDHILNQNYAVIYSSFSTIFLLSQSCQSDFVSVGLDKIKNLQPIDGYKQNLQQMGVKCI